ncbi:hypothetical protein X777_14707 [Ooceraea biroi]|uniref:Uncharacterized protein n=1 Tax=Ooceraea biroi TaxID=2015173 RepID=A0A026WR81_OOCBI|nr:hypothetical protein X777_14707 [Ooceraea biroi]
MRRRVRILQRIRRCVEEYSLSERPRWERKNLSPVLFLSTSAAGVIRLGKTLPYLLLLKCLSTGRDACQLSIVS